MDLVVESRLTGEFNGWDGETIFQLQNGQIWQQAIYKYRYHYAYMPRVKILRDGGYYYIEVEGVNDKLQVCRVE